MARQVAKEESRHEKFLFHSLSGVRRLSEMRRDLTRG
jgi:hypothetical protein